MFRGCQALSCPNALCLRAEMLSRSIYFLVTTVLMALAFAGATGCANIIPPSGGERDSIPPVLLRVSPKDSTLNFRSNKIVMEFDEYVEVNLNDASGGVTFSPMSQVSPSITSHLRTVTVEFKDTLLPNTTYILNFGKAIRDVNEGNALRNFRYVFSTGPYLDSLEIGGKVLLAETGQPDTTVTVILHRDLHDSAILNKVPDYATNVNRDGSFRFTNLPDARFAIYAIGNASARKTYNNGELLGFNDSLVRSGDDSIILQVSRPLNANATAPVATAPPLPEVPAGTDRRLRFVPYTSGALDLTDSFRLVFGLPLKNLDTNQIRLTKDSSFKPVSYRVHLDSTGRVLVFNSNWQENSQYNLELAKTFATDSLGHQLLKSDTLFFNTKKLSDYGSLRLKFPNLDTSKHPLLQIMQNNQVVETLPINSGVYFKQNFKPGDYELRVIYDLDNNGRWDPVRFFEGRRQAEPIFRIDRKITVKPNWDNQFDVPL